MKKFVAFSTSYNDEDGLNINIDVIDNPQDLKYARCGGYIESSDLDDLYTPAQIMVGQLTGDTDEELVETVVAAFRKILMPKPTVSINNVPLNHWRG
jgi:hypothetical protein